MRCAPARYRGFSLIELLVALCVGAGLLAATWSWAWTVAAAGHTTFVRSDALSTLAYARRCIVRDVRACEGVVSSPAPGSGRTLLALGTSASSTGAIRYSWDAGRGVLWRSSTSTYVAEGVTTFSIRYFDAHGAELAPAVGGCLDSAAAGAVRLLAVEFSVTAGAICESAHFTVGIR